MISVIHPTRRLTKAMECVTQWIGRADNPKDIEYILSIDADDNPELYLSILEAAQTYVKRFHIVIESNENVVQAMNEGVKAAKGDILVCISDDFICPQGWDSIIKANVNIEKEEALKVNDGISKMTDLILTLPILTKKLYDTLGYIYYHEYTGMHADNDLAELCEKMGVLKKMDVVFKHEHWLTNHYKKDAVNERHHNKTGLVQGASLLRRRRKEF